MLKRQDLEQNYHLNPPATAELIEQVQALVSIRLPDAYKNLLLETNGLSSDMNLVLHPVEDMPERNKDYGYLLMDDLPEYFMIGDDSGGQAILINEAGEIFEVGMGALPEHMEKSAASLKELLIDFGGQTLNERNYD